MCRWGEGPWGLDPHCSSEAAPFVTAEFGDDAAAATVGARSPRRARLGPHHRPRSQGGDHL